MRLVSRPKNPQAVAIGSMSLSAAAVAFLFHKLGWTLPDYYAIGVAGAAMTALSWVGREGLRGAWNRILNGSGDRPPGGNRNP